MPSQARAAVIDVALFPQIHQSLVRHSAPELSGTPEYQTPSFSEERMPGESGAG
jgi:hypothetical protein